MPSPLPPGVSTTKLGRFSFSEPSPYDTHAPNEGRFARIVPEWIRLRAGTCVGLNVYIERITQMSSITVEICGNSSLTSIPLRPAFLNWNGEGSSPPVCRSVRRSTELGRWPSYLARIGLGSNISSCDGPPAMNRKMTFLAFTGRCGPA
jgi:hypothetical protein